MIFSVFSKFSAFNKSHSFIVWFLIILEFLIILPLKLKKTHEKIIQRNYWIYYINECLFCLHNRFSSLNLIFCFKDFMLESTFSFVLMMSIIASINYNTWCAHYDLTPKCISIFLNLVIP